MLSITSATSVAATFIAFAAQAVKAQDTSDFSKCFCYNSQTNNFCNGNKWYNADACTDYINNNYSWTIVMVALALLMLTLPCFFVCARYCCRCCGGRYASHGCCCSDEASREFFPGYKNSSIIATRVAFIIAVALAITASAITMHHNSGLHDNVNNVITTVRTSANNLKSYSDAAPAFNQYLSTQPQYISASPVPTISNDGVDEFSRGVNTAHDVENNHWYGRHHLSQSVSAWTLVVPAIALLPMACSWKSSMNFFFIFHIIVAVIVLIAATPSAAASEFISEACHHYSTTSNFVGSGLQYVLGIPNGASLSQSVSNAQYSITTAFAAQTTQGTAGSGLGSSGSGTVTSSAPTFCSDFISVCASIGGCVSSPCGYATAAPHGCNGQAPTYFQVGPGYRASMMQAVTQTCSSGSTNIAAMSTSNAKANQLYQFALGTSAIGDLMAWDGYMWPITVDSLFAVCDAVKPKASSVAVGLFMQFVVSLVMLVVLFLGIKRFTHLNTYNTANDYTVVPQGAHVTAIIVVGEPQRPDYLLNAMPTTPTADYGSAVAKELPDSI